MASSSAGLARRPGPGDRPVPGKPLHTLQQQLLWTPRPPAAGNAQCSQCSGSEAAAGSWQHEPDQAQALSIRLQVLTCWRQHILSLQPLELLQTYGVPGLLFTGGTLLGKLCRHGYLTDLNMQLEVSVRPSCLQYEHQALASAILCLQYVRRSDLLFGNDSTWLCGVQAARMGAHLLQACFRCSISHPQRAVDHATYTPKALWEGADLFADQYR